MSAMVDVWVDELSKIREKVQVRKPAFLLRGKRRESMAAAEEENEQEGKKATTKERPSSIASLKFSAAEKNDNTLSEATICLLMDRFAPC